MDRGDKGRQLLYNMPSYQATKYHGLKNQGATCYLNSVLQVLFMTEDFREAVKRHICDNPGTEFIDHQLTSLFDDLQKHVTNTYNITKKLGIDNVYEQRDAAEYFEKILGLTSEAASQIFHGESTQKTKCSTCDYETDSNEAFWYLPLSLRNYHSGVYSVEDGIEGHFRASHFRGEDQMYCDVCEAKSDATITFEIKHHPEVLMLLLKRFDFDYHYMTYVKINRPVKVPFTLQIPENQTYELYAVVDHDGDLRSGHYTATIRSQDDERWHRFNDTWVSSNLYQPFEVDDFETSSSSYLLLYRKKKEQVADTCTQKIGETSSPGGFLPATNNILNDQCKDAVEGSQQIEGAAKADNETPVAWSIQIDKEAGIKDSVGFGKTQLLVGEKIKSDEEMKAQGGKRFTSIDVSDDGLQCNQAGKSKENRPKDEQNKPRVEERDVKGDQQQERGVDEHAQRKRASERQKQDQNGSSECGTTQKHVGAAMRFKGGNECVDGAEAALRRAGRSRVTENRGDGCVEKSQPSKATTALSEDTVEGRRNSKKSKTYHEKIIEEETRNCVQEMTVTKNFRITTVEGSSEGSQTEVTLSEGIYNLELNVPPLKEIQKAIKQTKTNNIEIKLDSNAKKMQNVSDAQEHAVKKTTRKRRFCWCFGSEEKNHQ